MTFKYLLYLLSILFIFILNCQNTSTPEESNLIIGKVIDSNGQPIPNAKVDFSAMLHGKVDQSLFLCGGGRYTFKNPNNSKCFIWISNKYIHDTLAIIDSCDTSTWILIKYTKQFRIKNIDGKIIKNGDYDLNFLIDGEKQSYNLLISRVYDSTFTYSEVGGQIITDSNGSFEIVGNIFPFGYHDLEYDSTGSVVDTIYISRYIKFYAICSNNSFAITDSVYLNENKCTEVTIVVP